MTVFSLADLIVALPEVVLAIFAMAVLMWGAFARQAGIDTRIFWLTSLAMIGLAVWVTFLPSGRQFAFGGMYADDALSRFAKVVILVAASIVLFISQDFLKREAILKFEFAVLAALAVLGMMVMVSANDLIAMYMGIELQSLSLYVMAAFNRDSVRSTEAGLKYFVLGALSSGLLLYGASITYGYTGTTNFLGISSALEASGMSTGLIIGLVFMIVGMAFKVSAVPFHMWTPDVYQGAPAPVTAFFATAPKVAAMVLFARLVLEAFGEATTDWQPIIAFLSVGSMYLGAIAAIGQRDIKRLMAYSSIAHMGFALMGLCAGTEQGLHAMLLYMVIYSVMNVGTFAFIMSMRREGKAVADIDLLRMYSVQAPLPAAALLLLMFSLAGIVPLVGFFAKLYVFQAILEVNMVWLAVAGGVASVIGAFYYLRIVYYMYFGQPGATLDRSLPIPGRLALLLSAALMLFGVGNLFGISQIADLASGALFS